MSTPEQPARRSLRRLVTALACISLALAAVPAGTAAVESEGDTAADEAADLRGRLLAERAQVAEQLGATEAALAEADRAVSESEEALEGLLQTRADVDAAIAFARVEREEPLEVRRAIAVQVYMAGDPAANSLLQEIIDGGSGIDGVRDRALYSSVVDWATENINRLDAEIERLTDQLAALDDEIPELESLLAAQRETAGSERSARDALAARIADIDQRLRTMNRMILTGLPTDQVPTRPILVVKIDNVGPARPQHGITAADIVIEEKVEAGLSRLAALFQSTGSDPVGPIRSARTSDVHLFANLGAPLFSYSGANFGVGASLASTSLIDVGATRHPGWYYRESSRRAPHNLYSRTSRLWAEAEGGSPPYAIFEFRSDGESPGAGARPSEGVDVTYGSARASFTWSPERGGWARTMDGRAHTAAGGALVAPANVVVRFVNYVPSPADARSPEAVVTGSGELWVFTGGHVVVGRWEQASATSPTRWLDSEGNTIRLTPGRTWILLPSPGDATIR
jgi:hypothetical protein